MGQLLRSTGLYIRLPVLAVLVCNSVQVHAVDEYQPTPWTYTGSLDYLFGGYTGITSKSGINAYGIGLTARYLDNHTLSFAYSALAIEFEDSINPITTIEQNQDTIQISAETTIYSDSARGQFTPGVQYQSISGTLADPALGDVSVIGAYLRYLNYAQSFYIDGHYAQSSYDQNITIDQQDVAFGYHFKNPNHWFQIRLYNIASSNFTEDYQPIDFLYKRWLSSYDRIMPDNVHIAFTVGDSLFAVDPDSQSVWNIFEERKQYIRAGIDWKSSDNTTFALLFSYSEFSAVTIDNKYENAVLYFRLTTTW